MKVIFSHGKESGPWGQKIKALASEALAQGLEVHSIDYGDTFDPEERTVRLSSQLSNESYPCILVGSSMGGYVSAVNAMRNRVAGLFLLAPAFYKEGYQIQDFDVSCPTSVVHGWSDNVIPVENSIRFARHNLCDIHILPGDHSLTAALPQITPIFREFLSSALKTTNR